MRKGELTSGYLRRVRDTGLSGVVRPVIAAEKSADGVVGETSFAEGLNAGKTERRLDVEISSWPCGRKSRPLAFGAVERVKPGRHCSKGRSQHVEIHDRASGTDAKQTVCGWRTAVYEPVCTVVWEGRSRETPLILILRSPSAKRLRKTQMKKPVINPSERNCPECMGTGFAVVKHPTRPGVRIYEQCKECLGKGRVAGN